MSALSVFFSQGFRPFFLLAAGFAAIAVPVWLFVFLGVLTLGLESPLDWHIHEMLFGYVSGALAGFLLTALPNWTGRARIGQYGLATLVILWLAGRVSFFVPSLGELQVYLPPAFLFSLALYLGFQVLAAQNYRNLVVVGIILLFGGSDLVFLSGNTETGVRLGFSAAITLISLIGGRIIPAFTGNWMRARSLSPLPQTANRFDQFVLLASFAGLMIWSFRPELVGILIFPGVLHLMRLSRWRALGVSEPLILMLHAAYLWLPVGLVLLGFGGVWPDQFPQSAGLHALGAGGVSLMTMIVMMRAILGHSNLPLVADKLMNAAFGLVFWGAVLRVVAAMAFTTGPILHTAALLWALGFVLFVVRFAPVILGTSRK